MEELVVLVDKKNKRIGTATKADIHTGNTPLHRAFSVFLFDTNGRLLLQQRSKKKKTWPLVWSAGCCGHPSPQESSVEAARRRLSFELGITDALIYEVIPNYSYRAEKEGVVEHEICPVLVGFSSQTPIINRAEVAATRWIDWQDFVREVENRPRDYSPWCVEETLLLHQSTRFKSLLAKHATRYSEIKTQ